MNVVYDDIIYSLQKHGGVSVYWSEITRNDIDSVLRIVYDSAKNNQTYDENLIKSSVVKSSRFLMLKRFLPLKVHKWKNDPFVFHSSYYRYCCDKNAYNVTTIHDFTNEIYGKGLFAFVRKLRKRITVARSKGIICVSRNTLNDFNRFFPNYRGFTEVIYNGFDSKSYYKEPNVVKERVVLFVGARRYYKRFDLAVRLACKFSGVSLVIVGGGRLSNSEIDLLERYMKNRYKKYDFICNDELRTLYNKAFFLCYPSEYEGFGIPIIEAQACGCPVVCQKKSCIPEVGRESVVYFSENEIENSNSDVFKLNNPAFYKQKVDAGFMNVKRFSWDIARESVYGFYKKILSRM